MLMFVERCRSIVAQIEEGQSAAPTRVNGSENMYIRSFFVAWMSDSGMLAGG